MKHVKFMRFTTLLGGLAVRAGGVYLGIGQVHLSTLGATKLTQPHS